MNVSGRAWGDFPLKAQIEVVDFGGVEFLKKTSFSLFQPVLRISTGSSPKSPVWSDLKEIAHMQRVTLSKVIAEIDKGRQQGNLSSAIRVFVFEQVRAHGNLWRYSRARRTEEEAAQMNGLPVQPSG